MSLVQIYTSWLAWLKHIPHSEFGTNLYLMVSLAPNIYLSEFGTNLYLTASLAQTYTSQ